jgi:hypothetical protein
MDVALGGVATGHTSTPYDSETGQVALIDTATRREVKVLQDLGKYRHVMIELAERSAK